jgi:hypothetical protein
MKLQIVWILVITVLIACGNISAQVVTTTDEIPKRTGRSNGERSILGVKLKPEITAIVTEIEKKCGRKLYAEFTPQEQFTLGTSFVDEDLLPVVLVDPQYEESEKLEAIIIHEILHLRLRVNDYPVFVFSPSVNTQQGRAIDVEQENVRDFKSILDHHLFKADMARYGVDKLVDLAGDTARNAKKRKGQESNNADIINYARAILEYPNPKDITEVTRIYTENGWTRVLTSGKAIADIIARSVIKTPADYERVFLECLPKLYPIPTARYAFKLTVDPANKVFRQMVISVDRRPAAKKRRK